MDNYGEVIAKGTKGILWSYSTYGSYQGDYLAIIEKDKALHIYKGQYGSCSGCDWLSDAGQYINEEDDEKTISSDEIQEYLKDMKPFLTIPKDSLPTTVNELVELLPANTRVWNDEDYHFKLENVLEQLLHPQFKNLDYLEAKYDHKDNNG